MPDQFPGSTGDRDWTDEVTDRIESVVGTVRDRTAVPATKAARGLVFGFVAGVLGLVSFVLIVIGLVRLLDAYLPFHPISRRVWTVDAVAGAIFLGAGAFLWRKRRPRSPV